MTIKQKRAISYYYSKQRKEIERKLFDFKRELEKLLNEKINVKIYVWSSYQNQELIVVIKNNILRLDMRRKTSKDFVNRFNNYSIKIKKYI